MRTFRLNRLYALAPALARSSLRRSATLASLFALTFISSSAIFRRRSASHAAERKAVREWEGREVAVVLIGSAACAHSRDPDTRRAFLDIVEYERRRANAEGARLVTVGIAVDPDVGDGLTALKSIAKFDEVVAGDGFLNTGALRFAVRDFAGPLSVPQVLILSRSISRSPMSITAGPDSLQRRLVGTQELVRWAARMTLARR
jgi:hypothetical protein